MTAISRLRAAILCLAIPLAIAPGCSEPVASQKTTSVRKSTEAKKPGTVKKPTTSDPKSKLVSAPKDAPRGPSATAPVLADRSLSTAEYVRLGMPAPDKVWTVAETATASRVLTDLAKNDPGKLPRFEHRLSGEMFARLISDETLEALARKDVSVNARYAAGSDYGHAFSQIVDEYSSVSSANKGLTTEFVELYAKALRFMSRQMDLIDARLSTVDKSNARYNERMKGEKMVHGAVTEIVVASLQLLSDSCIPTADKVRLLGHLPKSLPGLVKHLPPPGIDEITRQFDGLLGDPSLVDLRLTIQALSDDIAAAVAGRKGK